MLLSLAWVENVARQYRCEEEIFLGDFFDRPNLEPEEISALKEIQWNLKEIQWNNTCRIRHFIVGNHESSVANLIYNSTDALSSIKNNNVITYPNVYSVDSNTEFLFLPYIVEDCRKSLGFYLQNRNPDKKLIAFSHNDIKGVQMGKFISTTGFEVEDIEKNCDLYINGHLHNGSWITNKILNLGNLTGQNFNEDASKYEHHVAILDTDTLEIQLVENPYAMNFYKLEVNKESDLNRLKQLKNNAVIYVKCVDSLESQVRAILRDKSIIESKIVVVKDLSVTDTLKEQVFESCDHLKQFVDFILSKDDLENYEIVKEELLEVCK